MLTRIPGRAVTIAHSPARRGHALQSDSARVEANDDVVSICLNLTPRQRQILAVMMEGKSNKGICRALNLAEPTVKNHVTAILRALNVTNRTEAVLKVTQASASSLSYSYTIYPVLKQG